MPIAAELCGTVLDERYALRALIGEGAFGRVYEAHDLRLDRPVAVKLLGPWWAGDPGWVRVFTRETRMLARCSDPGIVRIFDAGDAPEGPYYVSELVRGEDLAQRLRRGRVGVAEARSIALGLCRGLAAAHALSIVHRDVKPGNVLLEPGSGAGAVAVKVADFGVARLLEAGAGEGTSQASRVVGTPKYMAPEQARGGPLSPAADVYSAGVVLYEMLAGRPPFTEGGSAGLALAHLGQAPPRLPAEVPDELRRVVARALAKDPAQRYPDAGAMARALAGAEAREPSGRPRGPDAGYPRQRFGSGRPGAGHAGSEPPDAPATLPAPSRAPRRTVHPAARRRAAAAIGLALACLGGLVLAAVLLGGEHRGGGRRAAAAAVRSVEVPLLVGEGSGNAVARLRGERLHARLVPVPAPGIAPGTVTSQTPVAGGTAPAGSVVRLAVSEVPRWRTVASLSATSSAPIAIRGERWRILVSASATHHCSFLVFCHSTSASVTRVGQSAPFASLGIADGTVRVFDSGPGTYRLDVDPATGSTRWTIRIQDDY